MKLVLIAVSGIIGVRAIWTPLVNSSFYVAYGMDTIQSTYTQAIVDVDGELLAATPDLVTSIHAGGTRIICYFSAGTYEDWRTDKAAFNASMLGSAVDGWAGEWWLDIRQQAVRDIIAARMQRWAALGCDGVDPDNVDGFANANGLGLTAADQRDFDVFIATAAHALGLAVGLKNNLGQVAVLEPYFDFAFNEQCVEYDECSQYEPITTAGKMVFGLEYNGEKTTGCPVAQKNKVSSVYTDLDLTGAQNPCNDGNMWVIDAATFDNGLASDTATTTITPSTTANTATTTTATAIATSGYISPTISSPTTATTILSTAIATSEYIAPSAASPTTTTTITSAAIATSEYIAPSVADITTVAATTSDFPITPTTVVASLPSTAETLMQSTAESSVSVSSPSSTETNTSDAVISPSTTSYAKTHYTRHYKKKHHRHGYY